MAQEQSKAHFRSAVQGSKGRLSWLAALVLLAACQPQDVQRFALSEGNVDRKELDAVLAEQQGKIGDIEDAMKRAARTPGQQKSSDDIAAVMGWNLTPNEAGAKAARAAYFRAHPDRIPVDSGNAKGDVEAGKGVYGRVCVACHDANGTGNGGTTGANLAQDKSRLAKSDEVLTNSIKNGVKTGALPIPMPPQGALVTDKEIKDVIAYMRATYSK